MLIIGFLLLTSISLSHAEDTGSAEETLVLVHAIFRHGNRNPDQSSLFASDPYYNYNFAPSGLGQLTNEGKLTLYKLGVKLRERYDQFLGPLFNPDIVYSRSTEYDRTKVSLKQMLGGLFPPNEIQTWNPSVSWQPVPTVFEKLTEDKMLFPPKNTEFVKLQDNFKTTKFYQNFEKQYQVVYDYIEQNANISNIDFMDTVDLYFTLTTENEVGLPLPEWTKNIFPEPLETMASQYYLLYTGTDELLKFGPGLLLRKILDDSKAKQNGTLQPSSRKLFLYSGHELNVASMLILLENFKPHVPYYGSSVLFELHLINGEYGFKIFYKERVELEPRLLTISNCGTFCPLDKFAVLFSKYL